MRPATVVLGDRHIGEGHPCYIVAEIGINHNGDINLAKRLIDAAKEAGCDAVKFQKRTPEVCVPKEQWEIPRETPWGVMSYIDYRRKIELGLEEYQEIDAYCRSEGITWFASPWDIPSLEFLEGFSPPCYKVASASLTDDALLTRLGQTARPVILSTGMSSMEQIINAVSLLDTDNLIVLHCNSSYPAAVQELNLRMIQTLRDTFSVPVGYSGHEVGLAPSLAAAALGACMIERHITLDRSMWGSDQAASVEPQGFRRLVRDIEVVQTALGDGVKQVYESELPALKRLRGT